MNCDFDTRSILPIHTNRPFESPRIFSPQLHDEMNRENELEKGVDIDSIERRNF